MASFYFVSRLVVVPVERKAMLRYLGEARRRLTVWKVSSRYYSTLLMR